MSKYIIDVGDAYVRHGLERTLTIPVRINEHEDHWMDTRIPVTPYTEPDLEQVREEAYDKGCQDATVKISSDEQAIAEKAYQKGLNDAWAAARWVSKANAGVNFEVFCTHFTSEVLQKISASEAIEKIKAYEQKEQEEQEEQESITAEDVMRQYLDNFCRGRKCTGCPLHTPDFTCGRGKYFLYDSMSDEEVRRAYATVLAKMKEEA